MTLNPITALSEQLQKLINEHGSAAILRDHLALFKDQVILLEKKSIKLTSENELLASKIQVLETEKQEFAKDNEQLRKKIQSYEQSTHDNLLDKLRTNILIFLSQQQKSVQTTHVAQAVNVTRQVAKFHLEELKTKKLINHSIGLQGINRGNDIWSLAHEGRRYLIEHKLNERGDR